MKRFIKYTAIFGLLALTLSGVTSCNRNAAPNTAANENTVAVNPEKIYNSENKSTQYPPLNPAIADAEFELIDGSKSKISDRKGKVVLVNFWGIWCGPCVAEMPALQQMQQAYADQGFEVIGMNIGADEQGSPETVDAIRAFAAKKNITYSLARIDRTYTGQFYKISKAEVVPQTFLINREGQLRGVFVGGGQKIIDSINSNVQRALNE